MLITVVIPAHNAADTIGTALDSVTAQTFREWEVIVADDASTDGTVKVAEECLQVSGFRFQVFRLPFNSGPAAARNRGVAEAKGEWIAFLDADDIWLPGKLETQLALAEQYPDVAMWCGATEGMGVSEYGGKGVRGEVNVQPCFAKATQGRHPSLLRSKSYAGKASNPTSLEELRRTGAQRPSLDLQVKNHKPQTANEEPATQQLDNLATVNSREVHLAEFTCGNPVATSTVLVKKAVLQAVGGFDEQFRGPEDYDLWMRIAARFPVSFIESPLARYCTVSGSLSMDDRKFLPEVLRVLEKAYGPQGALRGSGPKGRAVGYQYLACAWMAAERGAMGRAWRLFFQSLAIWPGSYQGAGVRHRWPRLKLFARFASLTFRVGRARGTVRRQLSGC